ncbi:MAG TPA: WYL domain-containing protein [Nocardioides sp.]|jgi:proteasome accessory factor C|uniref:helix-turn-helix transcriptional regulator n=1 Tax=Nocardioides sp. TaxID=35761 RepID=UPI002E33725E|nr:WYL domain-containing protein [Nocardioides sp.]HEX3931641.1 WYL domain-containing protein [Nocardioides sp.]
MSAATAGAAKEQVGRLLRLVPYLHAHDQVSLEEAARVIGVPPDQLDRDLRVLFLCGLPGGYPDDLIDVDLDALEGEGVIRVSNADYLARPLRLTPTEAGAIVVALRALRSGAGRETRQVVDRALDKLEQAAAGSTPLVDPGDDDPIPLALRTQLEDAVSRHRQVRLTYYVPARDEESERVVDPHAIVFHHGVAYLDAYCHSARAPRLFRLDRIHEATVLDSETVTEPAEPRDLSEGVFGGEEATRVTLRLRPEARWVEEYYAVQEVRPDSEGGSEVDLLVGDERWLQRLLLRLTPYAEVLSPAHFGDGAADAIRRALALYDHPAG